MKTIHLEAEDSSYQAILNFIKPLPESRCRILEEELSNPDKQHIKHCLAQIDQGDYSEFSDWESIKEQ